MKDMSQIYFGMPTEKLRKLRSKKYNRRLRLQSEKLGYFGLQELRVLNQQITWIDAVINSRNDQMWLIP